MSRSNCAGAVIWIGLETRTSRPNVIVFFYYKRAALANSLGSDVNEEGWCGQKTAQIHSNLLQIAKKRVAVMVVAVSVVAMVIVVVAIRNGYKRYSENWLITNRKGVN